VSCKGAGFGDGSAGIQEQQEQLRADSQQGTPPSATTRHGARDPLADDMSQLNLGSPVPSEVFYTPTGWGSSPGPAGQSPAGTYSSRRGQRLVGAAAAAGTPGGGLAGVELFYTPAPAAGSVGLSPAKAGTPGAAAAAVAPSARGGEVGEGGMGHGSSYGSLSCQMSAAGGGGHQQQPQQQLTLESCTVSNAKAAGGGGGTSIVAAGAGGDQQLMLPAMQFTLVLPAMQVMLPTPAAGVGGGATGAGGHEQEGGQVTPHVILTTTTTTAAAAGAQSTPVSGAWSRGPKALGALFEAAQHQGAANTGGKVMPGSAPSATTGGGGGVRTPDSGDFGGFKVGTSRDRRNASGVVRGRARAGAGQLGRDGGGVASLDQGGRRAGGIKAVAAAASGGGDISAGKRRNSYPPKWHAGDTGPVEDAEGKDQGEGDAGEQSGQHHNHNHNQQLLQKQRRRWSAPGPGSNSNKAAEVKGQEKQAKLVSVLEASGAGAAVTERMSAVARRNAAAVAQHMMRTRRQSAGAALVQLSWDATA
jgi:hypothetical protein